MGTGRRANRGRPSLARGRALRRFRTSISDAFEFGDQAVVGGLPAVALGDRPAEGCAWGVPRGGRAGREGRRAGVVAGGVEVPAGVAADLGQGRRVGQGDRGSPGPSPRRPGCRSSRRARGTPGRSPRRRRRGARSPGDSRASGSGDRPPAAAIAACGGVRASSSVPVPSRTRASSPRGHLGQPRPPRGSAGAGSCAAGSWPPRAGKAARGAGPGRPAPRPARVRVGRLEEEVLGGVGHVGHPSSALREMLEEPLGVEARDREDQVGPAKTRPSRSRGPGPRLEVLQHVVAGHGPARLPGGEGVLGRAVDPVDRPGPATRAAARVEPPPSQERGASGRATRGAAGDRGTPSRPARPARSSGPETSGARPRAAAPAARAAPGRAA